MCANFGKPSEHFTKHFQRYWKSSKMFGLLEHRWKSLENLLSGTFKYFLLLRYQKETPLVIIFKELIKNLYLMTNTTRASHS